MGHTGLLKQITNQQIAIMAAGLTMLLLASLAATIVLAVPLGTRSITPSSAAVSATDVDYTVEFTPATNAGAIVIDFCSNTPLIGQSCAAPGGMNVSTTATDSTNSTIIAAASLTANTPFTATYSDIVNPAAVGAIYARIFTYDTLNNAANNYSDTNQGAGVADYGSVAMYFNNFVQVSGTVLETLSFCVSSADITANCANATQPTGLRLGEETAPGSNIFALQSSDVSTGDLFTQINTNAAGGAVVRLRSSATCGGLKRSTVSTCDIAAAQQTDIAAGEAKFGLILATPSWASDLTEGQTVGTLRPYDGGTGAYYGSTYAFNFDNTNVEGVTSPFGDPFLDTNSAPATGRNMKVTFGASISNNTPAGTYSTDINMIAVGKF